MENFVAGHPLINFSSCNIMMDKIFLASDTLFSRILSYLGIICLICKKIKGNWIKTFMCIFIYQLLGGSFIEKNYFWYDFSVLTFLWHVQGCGWKMSADAQSILMMYNRIVRDTSWQSLERYFSPLCFSPYFSSSQTNHSLVTRKGIIIKRGIFIPQYL